MKPDYDAEKRGGFVYQVCGSLFCAVAVMMLWFQGDSRLIPFVTAGYGLVWVAVGLSK